VSPYAVPQERPCVPGPLFFVVCLGIRKPLGCAVTATALAAKFDKRIHSLS